MPKSLAVVLSSGGLHSLVTAGLASREYRIGLLHVKDGRPTMEQAALAVEKQAAHVKPVKTWVVEAPYLRQMSLPPETAGLVHSTGSDPQSNLIPLRELQLLVLGVGFAKQMHASVVLWGVQHEPKQADAMARNIELVQAYNGLLDLLAPEGIVVKTPLMGLEDQQVIELGNQMGVPFAASWTCQMPLATPCMSCPACARRTRAFRMAQLLDPLVSKGK